MLGLEAVLRACRTGGLPDLDRLRPAFESHAAEVAVREVALRELMRIGADDERAGLRQRLEPRGEVRRIAYGGVFARPGVRRQHIADDDRTGRDADPHL